MPASADGLHGRVSSATVPPSPPPVFSDAAAGHANILASPVADEPQRESGTAVWLWRVLRHCVSPKEGSSGPTTVFERRRGMLGPASALAFCIGIVAGTATAYALTIDHFKSHREAAPSRLLPAFNAYERQSPPPAYLHACFCVALTIEVYCVWRASRALVHAYSLRTKVTPSAVPQTPLPLITPTSVRPDTRDSRTTRLVRALLGSPRPQSPATPGLGSATLPTYENALLQGARQHARREATAVGWSAGRRGREIVGTGDAEDLELERLRRMGSLPPIYRSDQMRKDHVMLRGEAPHRSVWRLSHLSIFSRRSHATNGRVSTTTSTQLQPSRSVSPSILSRFSWRLASSADGASTARPSEDGRDVADPETPGFKAHSPCIAGSMHQRDSPTFDVRPVARTPDV